MTTSSSTTTPAATTDPRDSFAHAGETARRAIDGVRPDQLALPTVCDTLDVRSMVGHMVAVVGRITALGDGENPMTKPDVVTGVGDEQWTAVFTEALEQAERAWADPSKLDQLMELPWATAPGSTMLDMYTAELTVHTWDLATATGQHVAWHEPTVEVAYAWALQGLPPGDREAYFAELADDPRFSPELRTHPPFRNEVEVSGDAPTIDRLLGWYGRQPAPSPSSAA